MGQGDPVEIARKAVLHARDYGNDILILDTAGRLHIDEELMDELRRIKEAVQPQEILLVIDAMTGQDAVNVAKSFDETLGIDGTILTKLDGDTRGGAALSVRAVTGKPIKFVGTGEKLDNLEPFYPDRMASRILGMGDVLTLIEKAQSTVDERKAMEMAKKLKEQNFDMNDLLEQMQQIKQMGSLSQVISMFPGCRQDLRGGDRGRRSPAQEDRSHHQFHDQAGTGKTGNHQSVPEASDRSRKRYQGGRCKPSAQAV